VPGDGAWGLGHADRPDYADDGENDFVGHQVGNVVRSGRSGNQRTVRLRFGRAAVPLARQQIVADLRARQVPVEVVEEAESVVAELVANAVRHASSLPDGTVRLHWFTRDDVVEIEVTDGGGRTRPSPLRPAELSVSGRGLRIVRSLAHEWGVLDGSPARPGRTVWASVGGPSRRRIF
jgi:anti-sigma regulatory factor (Ser/Thr protein kinase)